MPRSVRLAAVGRRSGRGLQMIAIVLCSACTEECDSVIGPDYQANLVGVVSLDGVPLPGVGLRAQGYYELDITTDANGRYDITVKGNGDPVMGCLEITSEPYASLLGGGIVPRECFALQADAVGTLDLVITREGPTIEIDTPQDGAQLSGPIVLRSRGTAYVRLNTNAASQVPMATWSSSRDGTLGTWPLLSPKTVSLTVGTHVLTASVTNTLGASAMDQVTVEVGGGAQNQPPVATITSPMSGVAFASGEAVDFAGTGADPEDGGLSGAALAWTSSLEGAIGTGTSFSRVMADGSHVIVLTVSDAQGLVDSDTIAIVVSATTGTIQGTVSYLGDPLNAVPVELTGAATASTATDGQGRYSFTDLPAGTYTITITPPQGITMTTQQTVVLTEGETLVVNFTG